MCDDVIRTKLCFSSVLIHGLSFYRRGFLNFAKKFFAIFIDSHSLQVRVVSSPSSEGSWRGSSFSVDRYATDLSLCTLRALLSLAGWGGGGGISNYKFARTFIFFG